MNYRGPVASLFVVLALLVAAATPATADPSGTWLTQSGDTKVHIARCSNSYCGTIVWQKTPSNDTKNPDPAKRSRPLVGVQMIHGMTASGANQWSGQLYNPQDGKTYTGKLSLEGGDRMKLSGCVMGGLFCKSQTWTKSN